MLIVCFNVPKDREFGHLGRNAHLLTEMLHRCFDAVARKKVPESMSHLVEGVRPAREERPQAKPNMQQPQFVYCPFCLGTGQRSGWNAAQQPVSVCPECKGRGFLESTPDPASL